MEAGFAGQEHIQPIPTNNRASLPPNSAKDSRCSLLLPIPSYMSGPQQPSNNYVANPFPVSSNQVSYYLVLSCLGRTISAIVTTTPCRHAGPLTVVSQVDGFVRSKKE